MPENTTGSFILKLVEFDTVILSFDAVTAVAVVVVKPVYEKLTPDTGTCINGSLYTLNVFASTTFNQYLVFVPAGVPAQMTLVIVPSDSNGNDQLYSPSTIEFI